MHLFGEYERELRLGDCNNQPFQRTVSSHPNDKNPSNTTSINEYRYHKRETTYLIPTPPATNTTFLKPPTSTPDGGGGGGGQTKLPPTRTFSDFPMMSSRGLQSHAAGGFLGEFCTASSTYGCALPMSGAMDDGDSVAGSASAGVDVIVNPPAWGIEGMCTSSHWPGWNVKGSSSSCCCCGDGGWFGW